MPRSLVDILRERQDADRRELNELTELEVADFTPEREARATALATSIRDRQVQIDEAAEAESRQAASDEAARAAGETGEDTEERTDRAVVTREERTYTQERDQRGEASFFADSFRAMERGDMSARSRLERHAREVEVEGEVSTRATTTSSFAGLVVPQYLVDLAALQARAGRPFANTCLRLPLPDQGMVFYITKGGGAATAVQATQNTAVQNTDQTWSDVQVNVQTIAGQQQVSRQSLERGTPGLDSLIYLDLAGAYAVNLNTQVITGTGTGTKGIQNAGGNQASAFTAAATVSTAYTKVAGAINDVLTGRFLPPTHVLMHPRRWAWLLGQTDSTNRPLVVPAGQNPQNATANPSGSPEYGQVVGYIQGLPVVTDASVPTAVGTGPEDLIFVYRNTDCILWEDGDGMPRQLRFDERLGDQLTVNLVVYGYAAFTAERYPAGVSIVGGNAGTAGFGLVAPSF